MNLSKRAEELLSKCLSVVPNKLHELTEISVYQIILRITFSNNVNFMSQGLGKCQRFMDDSNWILLSWCTLHFSNRIKLKMAFLHKRYTLPQYKKNLLFSYIKRSTIKACPFA